MRHDVVLWGATGFTGALVAEYLLRTEGVGGALDWALAGRNRTKLEALRSRLTERDPAAADLPLIVGDAADRASLDALAARTKVIATTVGPYDRYGDELVAACVAQGTHYCDLTGEPHWMKRMIGRHHAEAEAKQLRIVHTCGFDSIPSDLGCLVLQDHATEVLGAPLGAVTLYVRKTSGGFSGGTIATFAAGFSKAGDRDTRRAMADPYSLLPPGAPRGPKVKDVEGISWDADEQCWTGPFVMATTNAKVVRRSHALLGMPWGQDFRYREVFSFRKGTRGLTTAIGITGGLGAFIAAMSTRVGRRLLIGRVLPRPGEGPSREAREAGSFVMHLVGKSAQGKVVRVVVKGDQDPGYGSTAGMIGEAAICLAKDGEALPQRFGVLTPASAMGQVLVKRLPRAGVSFEATVDSA